MNTKSNSRSLLARARRLLRLMANVHPLVVAIAPTKEQRYEQGATPAR